MKVWRPSAFQCGLLVSEQRWATVLGMKSLLDLQWSLYCVSYKTASETSYLCGRDFFESNHQHSRERSLKELWLIAMGQPSPHSRYCAVCTCIAHTQERWLSPSPRGSSFCFHSWLLWSNLDWKGEIHPWMDGQISSSGSVYVEVGCGWRSYRVISTPHLKGGFSSCAVTSDYCFPCHLEELPLLLLCIGYSGNYGRWELSLRHVMTVQNYPQKNGAESILMCPSCNNAQQQFRGEFSS